ncbi:MAG: PDDEXK nuclease domain-containing protein, partial [Isosphaeraceae bacterium]
MGKKRTPTGLVPAEIPDDAYEAVLAGITELLESARRAAARSINSIMTETYWEVGRRIFEEEQKGRARAAYGERLIERLSQDLTTRFGRGFSKVNLKQMRKFYREWGTPEIGQTASDQFAGGTPSSAKMPLSRFPLSWSHYVSLLSVRKPEAREFYEAEALRCGWTVRQLDRQVGTQFYERTLLSRDKAAMLRKGQEAGPDDVLTPEEEIKDPFFLEFLNLKDEYSESDLEEALIRHLETFLLELGNDFTFVGRQRRLRIDDEWFRVDLLFFHRRLRCLILVDLLCGRPHKRSNVAKLVMWRRPEQPPVPSNRILVECHISYRV